VTGLLVALALGACGRDLPDATSESTAGLAATAPVATTAAPTTTTEAPTTTTTAPPPPPPAVPGSQLPPGPNTLYVLGDSVILGAQATVPAALAGWDVTFDAKESRRIDQGTGIVQARGGAMGRVLVVHLCTNWGGGDYRAAAEGLLASLSGVDRVVWVTCTPWLPAVGDADEVIRSLPAQHPDVVVADWAAASGAPGYTYSDGLHLRPEGAAALAQLVASTVGPPPAPA
jgi:hypothetical protein